MINPEMKLELDSLDLMAGLVLEDGRRWGEAAERFQWEDAQAVLDADAEPFGGAKGDQRQENRGQHGGPTLNQTRGRGQ